jgi:hypothetical protein
VIAPGDHPLALGAALHGGPQLLDHADRLVADRQAPLHRVLAFQNVHVGAAVVVVTRTRASSGPTSGIGFSSSTMRPGSTKTAAFILAGMGDLGEQG